MGGLRWVFEDSYYLYTKAMERALRQVSILVRYRKGPYYARRFGEKYGPRQKQIAEQWRKLRPFAGLDINTCILQSKILLDKTISLSQVFLEGTQKPSFTSFNKHKKFFLKDPRSISNHEAYAKYLIENTSWFDNPLKLIRDKFIVHSGPKHQKAFTIGWEGDDLSLFILIFDQNRIKSIDLNVWRLSYEIEEFLVWFGSYGIKALENIN